jgi:hypothetical protein
MGTISWFLALVVLDAANIGRSMNGSLGYILELSENPDAALDVELVNEDTGYNPYDNPGAHKEMPDEAG